MEILTVILPVIFLVLVGLFLFWAAIKIVNQYERLLVFTLGRTSPQEVKGPGWVFVVPILQRGVRVDLREQFIEVPSQTNITKDNAPISIDFLIYWRIADPYKSVVEVQNFNGALQNIATTTLRAVIGDILLDDVLSKREQINEVLRVKLDEVTERWGGKVTTVEIREITPPREVQDAMNRQLSAERTRRAVITESEGARQSAINVAEGTKQAEILRPRAIARRPSCGPRDTRSPSRRSTARPHRSTIRRWRSSTSRRSRPSARARRRSTSCRSRSPASRTRSGGSSRGPTRIVRPSDRRRADDRVDRRKAVRWGTGLARLCA
jgi:regulator of protease activity HflC (stomatin/prohibitin superfamily)